MTDFTGPQGAELPAGVSAAEIDEVRVRVFEVDLANPVPMSFSSMSTRKACLIEVSAGGLVGIGESWINFPPWAWIERVATLGEGVAPLLRGANALDIRGIHEGLVGALAPLGRQWGALGPMWQAISAVDLALWDLYGKLAKVSVAHLLTANPRTSVPVYASGIGPDDTAGLADLALREGFTAVKVKVGFGRPRDESTLKAVRSVVGDAVRLFADANQAWSLREAIEMCKFLKDQGVEWCEEPIAGNCLSDLEALYEATSMPLATGENVYALNSFRKFVDSPAIHQIQPDLAKNGGLTLALDIADIASATGTSVAPHCYTGCVSLAASAQFAAARDEVQWVELDVRENALRTNMAVSPIVVRDGCLEVPAGLGLGVVLDEERLAAWQLHPAEPDALRHDA